MIKFVNRKNKAGKFVFLEVSDEEALSRAVEIRANNIEIEQKDIDTMRAGYSYVNLPENVKLEVSKD